jgi:ankyrin repeat protein
MDSSTWGLVEQTYEVFFFAIESGNVGFVKEFLKSNINIDLLHGNGSEGQTALHIGASSGNIEQVSLLLPQGASVNILNYEPGGPSTPLHNAGFSVRVPIM